MSAKRFGNPQSQPRRRASKRRGLHSPARGRRPHFERLEIRNLLTAGLATTDIELLAVTAWWEEAPAAEDIVIEDAAVREGKAVAFAAWDGEVVDAEFDGAAEPVRFSLFVADDETDRMFERFAMDFAVGEGQIEEEIGWLQEDELPVRAFVLMDSDAWQEDEDFVAITAFDGDNLAGEFELLEGDPSAEITLFAAMGPSPWQNLDNPDDVNADGWITPYDALLVINRVNEGTALSALASVPTTIFADVNGDRSLDTTDAVQVINTLNGSENLMDDAESTGEEVASRVAPLWYHRPDDGNPEADAATWQERDDEQADGAPLDMERDLPDTPWVMPRLMPKDEAWDRADEDASPPPWTRMTANCSRRMPTGCWPSCSER